ncbi:MAG: MFS transporter [Epulopiscium sp.]|nr:MFS transporter [Candidatus Epulonipiscium sp.]
MIFALATSFFWFSLYAYMPELSTYAEVLGASYKMIGIIGGAYGFTQMILRIPLGILSDRLNKRKGFIILGMLVSIASSLITFIYPTVASLLICRLLAGVAASTWVVFTVLFASYYKSEEATKAVGIINVFNAAGQMVAMLLGGIISWYFGTRYLFLLGAIGGSLGLILSFAIFEEKNIERKPIEAREILKVARDKNLLLVSMLAIISQIINFATIFGFVPILARNLGANSIQLSILSAISIVPTIMISGLSGTLFIKWWGERKTILIGFGISSILCMFFPIVPNILILFIVVFISGIGRSMVFPLLMGLGIKQIEDNKRATAMGFFQAIYGIGMILGPIILGFISDVFSLTTGFVVTGLIGMSAIVMVYCYKEI